MDAQVEQAAPTEDTVARLLVDDFEADAIWSQRGVVVARGRPVHLDESKFRSLEERFRPLRWSLRWERANRDWLIIIEQQQARRVPWLAVGLFLATVVAVVFLRPFTLTGFSMNGFAEVFWSELPFAYALFPILLAHEFGHYFAARAHHYPSSLPYFIPGFYPFGTFGAVIIARHPFRDRKVLFDVAVAGPIAGFVACIPVLWYGLAHSTWISVTDVAGLRLGDPLLMKAMAQVLMPQAPGPDMDILLHPAAFGGWAGLFVTMLNLLPFGPLDGGKTAYALFGQRQRWVAMVFWGLLAVSLVFSYFWLIWLALALVFRLPHPPTLNDHVPLGRTRLWVGVAVMMIFILAFMPMPIYGSF
jgi:membrane-associated protease RseP (regulator of RpoE activity)